MAKVDEKTKMATQAEQVAPKKDKKEEEEKPLKLDDFGQRPFTTSELVDSEKRNNARNKPKWTRCGKCGFRIKGDNHDEHCGSHKRGPTKGQRRLAKKGK